MCATKDEFLAEPLLADEVFVSGECYRFVFQKCGVGNGLDVFLGEGGVGGREEEILCKCQLPERPYCITVVRLEGQWAGANFARCEQDSQQNGARLLF